jgi:hypothetical protein
MLSEYDILSDIIRFGEPIGRVRGYHRADFTDAWARYCPPQPGGTRDNRATRDNPRSGSSRFGPRHGSTRDSGRGRDGPWHGSTRDAPQTVTPLTCDDTVVTGGTDTPLYRFKIHSTLSDLGIYEMSYAAW